MAGESKQVLEYAVSKGFLTQEQIEECARIQTAVDTSGLHKTLIQVIIEKGYLSKDQLRQLKAELGLSIAQVGDYGILSKLGEGGMGKVYKARRLTDGKIIAIKLLSQRINDKEHIERFAREIAAGSELNHPNIVGIIDSGTEGGNYYYVMEYVEGKNLDKIIEEQGIIPEEQAAEIVMQVADALDYASKKGLVHRDIKPANIIIASDGIPRLCDFGIAKFTTGDFKTLTVTGVSISTPHYASPEQAKGEKNIDVRSDLYSLGVTLFHMVTGKVPFEGTEPTAILMKHINKLPPNPKKINSKISDEITNVILKLMGKKPTQRYQTPGDLIKALTRVEHKKASRQELAEYLKNKGSQKDMESPVAKAITPQGGTRKFSKGAPKVGTTTYKKPSPITFIAIAATILVVVILAIIFSNSSSQKGDTKDNSAQSHVISKTFHTNTSENNEGKNEVNYEELAAKGKFDEAEQLFSRGDYDLAKDKYNAVVNYYGTTNFLKHNREKIMSLLAKCEEAIFNKQKARAEDAKAEAEKLRVEGEEKKDTEASFVLLNAKKNYEAGYYDKTIELCSELLLDYKDSKTVRSSLTEIYELIAKSKDALANEKKAEEMFKKANSETVEMIKESTLRELIKTYPKASVIGAAKNELAKVLFAKVDNLNYLDDKRNLLKGIISEFPGSNSIEDAGIIKEAEEKLAKTYIENSEWERPELVFEGTYNHYEPGHYMTTYNEIKNAKFNGVQLAFFVNEKYVDDADVGIIFLGYYDGSVFKYNALYLKNNKAYFIEAKPVFKYLSDGVEIDDMYSGTHKITALIDNDGYLTCYYDYKLIYKSTTNYSNYMLNDYKVGVIYGNCKVTFLTLKIRGTIIKEQQIQQHVVEAKGDGGNVQQGERQNLEKCSACNGWGYFNCNKCNGTGIISHARTCIQCKGTGTIQFGKYVCNNCNGSGYVYASNDNATCIKCEGRGKINCSSCNGTGKLKR